MPNFNLFNFRVVLSQNEIYKPTHISESEGLSQSSVIPIDQDSLNQI